MSAAFDEEWKSRSEKIVIGYARFGVLSCEIPADIYNLCVKYYHKHTIDKIPLRVHSQRGHRNDMDDYHPSKLLQSDESCYFSQINDDFEKDEPDWIIFEYDQLYMPKQITIRNLEDKRGLKTFRVFIGDGNQWHIFAPKEINAKINDPENDPQTFTIGEIDHKLIGKQQFKQIKVEFMKNHGETNRSWSRFAIKEIQLFGVAY